MSLSTPFRDYLVESVNLRQNRTRPEPIINLLHDEECEVPSLNFQIYSSAKLTNSSLKQAGKLIEEGSTELLEFMLPLGEDRKPQHIFGRNRHC
jgi:hypothetical protein